ncbi:YCF48-related protein [Paraburkholderia sp. CNPSo 3281]|uniref:WD40/YVTN/BNR-like repeat-containing protein n=1 Tax=Paraburkholderia sp. CNPSo 3281 TaxID=2940933 RepID=UPI0020B64575|nr:YCF48-related protein [Paraburkholderia sp. CNPSo 3281]MCP3720621.1 YCF48-related protein [Paraburkholderia sp. CNPSo 3281]
MRGLIAISEDGGRSWSQSPSPVQSDLLDVVFGDAATGWVVGHDGVILKSIDGGGHWAKVFDGRIAAQTLPTTYKRRIEGGAEELKKYVEQLTLDYKAGPSLPFLSIWARDGSEAISVGAFGLAVKTQNGGKNWEPILETFENPEFLHLNAIREIGGDLFVAAEKGTIFGRIESSDRFVAFSTGYQGSFFGVDGDKEVTIAYGLHGTLYRSLDRGVHWMAVPTSVRGTITSSTNLGDGRFILVSANGEVALFSRDNASVRLLRNDRLGPLTGVCALPGNRLAVSGLSGISTLTLS